MLFGSILTLALIPLSLAGPLVPRTAADILKGISTLSSDIGKLQSTLNTFKANDILAVGTALKIQQQSTQIETDLKNLISATQKTGDLSSDDTSSVATAVVNLEPTIKDLLNLIVQKKPAFATAVLLVGDLSKTVLQSLTTQRSLTAQFASVLTPKLAEPYRDFAPLIAGQIDGYFAQAIAAYQQCSGVVCLPPIPS